MKREFLEVYGKVGLSSYLDERTMMMVDRSDREGNGGGVFCNSRLYTVLNMITTTFVHLWLPLLL